MDSPLRAGKDLDQLYIQALLLAKVIERVLEHKAKISLIERPKIEKRTIVEFMKRMRVGTGVEKFLQAAYISVINYFISEDDMRINKPIGAIVLYIEEDYMPYLFKKMGYPHLDEDDQTEMEDACGTLCNLICAKFKTGLTQLGYADLEMSHFLSYRNEILNGVEYDISQKNKYEVSIFIDGEKKIAAEVTMGEIPDRTFF